jgi:hypothetical protein
MIANVFEAEKKHQKTNVNKKVERLSQTNSKNKNFILNRQIKLKPAPIQNSPMQNGPIQNSPMQNGPIQNEPIQNNKKIICSNIKTIHNVFKLCFCNDVKPTGFGDFIRGCYFLLQFSRENNLNYKFHIIEHPISNYLKQFQTKTIDFVPDDIYKLETNNFSNKLNNNDNIIYSIENNKINDFIDFINSMTIYGCSIFINTNNCPKMPILNDDILIIKNMLEPTQEIEDNVNKKFDNLLLEKYNFSVIHIRMGDEYIIENNHTINTNKIDKLFKHINNLPNTIYLLITDCTIIKQYIIKYKPFLNIKFIINDITHTGENSSNESIKNTLVDFYMMSYSKYIYSFSVYSHGSGFSQWCATTYDIPYSCKFIE